MQALDTLPVTSVDAFRLPAPWDALVGLLLVAGIIGLGLRLAPKLGLREPIARPVAVALVPAVLSAVVFSLCALGVWPLLACRVIGAAIVVSGVPHLFGREVRTQLRAWRPVGTDWLVLVVMGLFVVLNLGPPTEGDGLDYHLPSAMRWLHDSGISRDDWWIAFRFAAEGDALIALGLACGTDVFGQLLGVLGLTLVLVAVSRLCQLVGGADQDGVRARLVRLLVLSAPLLLLRVSSPKPFLLGYALLLLGFVLLLELPEGSKRAGPNVVLAGLLWGAAAGSKHSFLLGIATLSIAWLVAGGRASFLARLRLLLVVGITAFAVALPIYINNLLLYGDPLSPLFARPLGGSVSEMAYAQYVQGWYDRDARALLRLPLTFALPRSPGEVSLIAGPLLMVALPVGVLLGLRRARASLAWTVGLAALLSFAANLALTQLEARFFLDSFFVGAAAAAALLSARLLRPVTWVSTAAAGVVGLSALYAVVTLAPGALGESLRDRVLARSAHEYATWRWANPQIAGEPAVLTWGTTRAFASTPYLSDYLFRHALPAQPRSYHHIRNWPEARGQVVARFIAYAQKTGARYYVGQGEPSEIASKCSKPFRTQKVPNGRRSPINQGMAEAHLRLIDWDLPTCRALIEPFSATQP